MKINDKLKKTRSVAESMVNTDKKRTILSMSLGAGSMGVIGSSVGIAMFGTAIAGTLPFAITGALIGGLGYKAYSLSKNNKENMDLK